MLPKVVVPEFSVLLPSLNKNVKYRPFLAKEEKILLTALEDKNLSKDTIQPAIKQMLKNCILTDGIDVDTLSRIDVECLLLNIRKRSVGETVELAYDARELFECSNEECIETLKYTLKLDKFEITNEDNVNTKIMLSDDIGVVLKQLPLFVDLVGETSSDRIFLLISKIIDKIFTSDDVIEVDLLPASEREKLPKWVEESFNRSALDAVLEFLSRQPGYRTKFDLTCPKCGKSKSVEVDGIIDFFI